MPNLKKMYESFDEKVHVISRKMGVNSSYRHYIEMLKEHDIPFRRLTSAQKKEVDEFWKGLMRSDCYETHELAQAVTGKFDPSICSEMLFRTNIELKLNDFKLKWGWSDKNYFDMYLPNIPMPKTVARNVNGVWLDSQFHPIAQDDLKKLLNSYDQLIVKPSIENGFGKSVKLYQAGEYDQIISDFRNNFLVQEVFEQHSSVATLNASSVNVVRVISLSLNGVVSPVNYALRCGAAGSITDNQITEDGRGMFIIGVNPDGTLKDKAVFSCGEMITQAPNGVSFSDVQLPNFGEALKMTTQIHEMMPHFGFMGFDVCFNKDGAPTIMEYNIKGPGVLYYQYVNGALFGDRTQEVIDTFSKR